MATNIAGECFSTSAHYEHLENGRRIVVCDSCGRSWSVDSPPHDQAPPAPAHRPLIVRGQE